MIITTYGLIVFQLVFFIGVVSSEVASKVVTQVLGFSHVTSLLQGAEVSI